MKANDYCLSLEQAKELQKLGIEFTEASMEFTHYDTDGADEWYLTMVDDYADSEFADIEHILTLTCTEMISMLPKYIDLGTGYGSNLEIIKLGDGDYRVGYSEVLYCVGQLPSALFTLMKELLEKIIKSVK